MTSQLTIYIALIATSGVLNTYLGYFAFQNRRYFKEIALFFVFYTWAIAIYCFGAAFGLTARTLVEVKLWTIVQYIGMPISASLGLLFIMHYLGFKIDRKRLFFLLVIPVLTFFVVVTNDWHQLHYTVLEFDATKGAPYVYIEVGPWYAVHGIFTFGTMLAAFLLIGRRFRETQRAYRLQIVALALGQFIPMFTSFLYLTGVTPDGVDPVPMVLWISSLLYLWAIRSSRLFSILPVAKEAIFQSMKDGVVVLDESHQVIEFNRTAQRMFPFFSAANLGQSFNHVWATNHPVSLTVEDLQSKPLEIGDSQDRKYRVQAADLDGGKGQLVVFTDVTEVARLQQELEKLAYVDELTRLANRRAFFQKAERDFLHVQETDGQLVILLLDLDHFKRVNDVYGHAVGDEVLIHISRVIEPVIPENGIFARYGGEEFVILVPDMSKDDALYLAKRIQNELKRRPLLLQEGALSLTISIGIAEAKMGLPETLHQVVMNADLALYQAKEAGRNRAVVFEKLKRE